MTEENIIEEALKLWANHINSEKLSYLAFVQHFEERWVQTELGYELSLILNNPNVWMECYKDKRCDIGIYEKVNKKTPKVIIEIKTVKNYDLSTWTNRLELDRQKLKTIQQEAEKEGTTIKCFSLVISLFARPKSNDVFWYKKRIEKEKYEEILKTKEVDITKTSPLLSYENKFFSNIELKFHLEEI